MRSRLLLVVCVSVGASSFASPAIARNGTISDEDQRRALLAQLAAASAEAPPEERTDADLMYEAMKQWRGEPRGSAAVDRVLAQSKKETGRERKVMEEKIRSMFWKDPFSERPHQLIAVRKEDRDLLGRYEARHSGSGAESADSEVARLRAEVLAARAETARLRAELAHVGQAAGSGESSLVRQNECGRAVVARHEPRHRAPSRYAPDRLEAWNSPMPSRTRRSAAARPPKTGADRSGEKTSDAAMEVAAADMADAPPPAASDTSLPPAGAQSSDPRGIIVVPLKAVPLEVITIHAHKPRRAR
jgi:hypothetical protein